MSSLWKSVFNYDWCDPELHPDWALWITADVNNPYVARCKFCCKSFSLSNMGATAIKSHAKGKTHLRRENACKKQFLPIEFNPLESDNFNPVWQKPEICETEIVEPTMSVPVYNQSRDVVPRVASNDDVLKSEIIWVLRNLMNGLSFKNCRDDGVLFRAMFPDSEIAKHFEMDAMKASYLVTYGLAPYFKRSLLSKLETSDVFCLRLNQFYNKVIQQYQMDFYVRFWDNEDNKVMTRYYTSIFFERSSTSDITEKVREVLLPLSLKKILQISMGSQDVNLGLLNTLKDEIQEESGDGKLLDIGSSGVNNFHWALQSANQSVDWNLESFICDIYSLLKNGSTRREDFMDITKTDSFPLKFDRSCWIKNGNCINRTIEIFDSIKLYISKAILPKSALVQNIRTRIHDPLQFSKVVFLKSVFDDLEPVVEKFQRTDITCSSLFSDFGHLLKILMCRFVDKIMLSGASPNMLMNFDVRDPGCLVDKELINIGSETLTEVNKANISQLERINFYSDCQKFLVALTESIMDFCPLKHELVRGLSALDPYSVISGQEEADDCMNLSLKILHENERLNEETAHKVTRNYGNLRFAATRKLKEEFQRYFQNSVRLDVFYFDVMYNREEYKYLWTVVKKLLILFHGDVTTDVDFSVYDDLIDILKEESVVALCQVYESVNSLGGIYGLEVNSNLLQFVDIARGMYHTAVEEGDLARDKAAQQRALEKRKHQADLKELHEKKRKLNMEHNAVMKEIDSDIKSLERQLVVLNSAQKEHRKYQRELFNSL